MSSYYLCDTCRNQAGSVEMNNYCCLAPGKGSLTYKTRKVVSDEQTPAEVCKHWKPKEKE